MRNNPTARRELHKFVYIHLWPCTFSVCVCGGVGVHVQARRQRWDGGCLVNAADGRPRPFKSSFRHPRWWTHTYARTATRVHCGEGPARCRCRCLFPKPAGSWWENWPRLLSGRPMRKRPALTQAPPTLLISSSSTRNKTASQSGAIGHRFGAAPTAWLSLMLTIQL